MLHRDSTDNHRLERWVYANAAARTAATGFVAGDVGQVAYQLDNGTYWRLTATTPTWASIGVAGATSLDGLSDVTVTTPANNQALLYETSSGEWKNKTLSIPSAAATAFQLLYPNTNSAPLFGGETLPGNALTPLTMTRVYLDTTATGGPGTGGADGTNARFVVPAGVGGLWFLQLTVKFDGWSTSAAEGYLVPVISLNSTGIQSGGFYRAPGVGDKQAIITVSTIAALVAGDIVKPNAYVSISTGTYGGFNVIESSFFGYRIGT